MPFGPLDGLTTVFNWQTKLFSKCWA